VHRRAGELARLDDELSETRKRVRRKLRELDAHDAATFAPDLRASAEAQR
jgi:hypothetical protein